ncbi:hypothetical protein [Streptomyces sp. TLI_105]|uniref:hypothetical protein n=1 Tax=Streptomyces sp. TLI_105 TaxID=1881019 RepID=UPI00115FC976|nr:hypothetical protein [Streptomyces sp. TLI_105]
MTTTTMRLAPIGAQRTGSETVRRPDLEPIFTELARQWQTAGRLVPGQPDQEWMTLTLSYPWPGR